MASNEKSGSIILKILILIFVGILIAVILIPVEIWEEEEELLTTCRGNLTSIYEAHKYYHFLKNEYTTDIPLLIETVTQDSSLKVKRKVVNYTQDLRDAIDAYLETSLIESVSDISQNLKNIETDFENNVNFFKMVDEIYEESENLKLKISGIQSGIQNEKYSEMAESLDSLLNLKRDLADFQLQTAARLASSLAEHINQKLPSINFNAMENEWMPINQQINVFMADVNNSVLKQRTSVAERVKDFQNEVISGFTNIKNSDINTELGRAQQEAQILADLYKQFLSDFLATESYCRFRLSDSDSMLLNLSEDNFTTPYENKPYHVEFQDTLGILVEDPTLVEYVRHFSLPIVEDISNLPFMTSFAEYLNSLDSLKTFALEIKTAYRRNAEVHFAYKDLELKIDEIIESTAANSYQDLEEFTEVLPVTKSYSEIHDRTDVAFIAAGIFEQILNTGIYGNFDSLHIDIINQLNQFEELISKIKRNKFSFTDHITSIENAHNQIKQTGNKSVLPQVQQIKTELEDLFVLVSEGIDIPVYGVFSMRIVNHGKVYGLNARKSWED